MADTKKFDTSKANEAITGDNIYDVILSRAIEQARKNLPKEVVSISEDKGAAPIPFSIDQYVDRMLSKYDEKGLRSNKVGVNPEIKQLSLSTSEAVRAMYGMCVVSEIKKSMDDVLRSTDMKKYIKDSVRVDVNQYIDSLMSDITRTEQGKHLVDTLQATYSDYSQSRDTIQRFLNQGLNFIDEVNKNVLDKNMSPQEAIAAAQKGSSTFGAFDKSLSAGLSSALNNYSKDMSNTIIINSDINTGDFLKHFNEEPTKLTQAEKQWARDTVAYMLYACKQKAGENAGEVNLTHISIDGKPAVSEQEYKAAQKGEIDPATLECRIAAAWCSQKNLTIGVPMEKQLQKETTASADKQEAAQQETAKQESAKQETAKQETAKQESTKQETAKQESAKQESTKQETAKQESAKQESAKQETAKQESDKKESTSQIKVEPQPEHRKLENIFDLIFELVAAILKAAMEKKSTDIELDDVSAENSVKKENSAPKRERMTFDDLVKEDGGVKKMTSAPKKSMDMDKDKTKTMNTPSKKR